MQQRPPFEIVRPGDEGKPERDPDHGLTPSELEQMLSTPGKRLKGLVTIEQDISPQLLREVPIVHRVTGLLRLVSAGQGIKLTPKGNLSLAAVKQLVEETYSRVIERHMIVRREEDCAELRFDRRLAEHTGLLKVEKNRLVPGLKYINPDDENALPLLYASLLTTLLKRPQLLTGIDGLDDANITPAAWLFMLHLLRGKKSELFYPEDFADPVLQHFPDRFSKIRPRFFQPIDELRDAINLRFFLRFCVAFGLCRPVKEPWKPPFPLYPPGTPDDFSAYQRRDEGPYYRTELFDTALTWLVPAPPGEGFGGAGQRHALAAGLEWTQEAMELQEAYEPNPTTEYLAKVALVRSMERCPQLPDPYYLWARMFYGNPAYMLTVLDTGLAACAHLEPEVPPGVSPWRDHMYRDIIRMQLLRASTLVELQQPDKAAEQLTELMTSMPEDELLVRHRLFTVLVCSRQLQQAEQLIDREHTPPNSCDPWNAVLLAYAKGGAEAARPLAEQAIKANPLVPEILAGRLPPELDDYYETQQEADAMYYASLTWDAWKSVKGARAWCSRLV